VVVDQLCISCGLFESGSSKSIQASTESKELFGRIENGKLKMEN
jgi:hypothetical protein